MKLIIFTLVLWTCQVAASVLSLLHLESLNKRGIDKRAVVRTINAKVPKSAPAGRQVIDAAFQSFSIEFSYMLDYAGNNTHPNKFSYNIIQSLKDISGAYPIIRAGGTTQNRANFYENQTTALIQKLNPGADQPSSLSVGPTWMQSFQQFPSGTQYIYGLNFYDGDAGKEQAVLQAVAAFDNIGDNLYAFEIGNEVDGFNTGTRRPTTWGIKDYVKQWKEYAAAIEKELGRSNSKPLFQAGNFQAPRNLVDASRFTAATAIKEGIDSTGMVKTISDHDYMGSNCGDTNTNSLVKNILNHARMTSLMWYHEVLGNYSVSQNIPYVIGETNSISCQGQLGLSDVFAASLWSIDYTLYVATLSVSRIYFHNGTPYRYSAWQPIATSTAPAQAKPLFYGSWFIASALSGGNKQVALLVNETRFTAYAIYEASPAKLSAIAVINLEIFNTTMKQEDRPITDFVLPSDVDVSNARVRRLTAPGVEKADNITWAAQHISSGGTIAGTRKTEKLVGGGRTVEVGAGEAVLVSFVDFS
ncbi:hypothetical protein HYFRA_00000105 [Hymenoscyphus fraxineus]|uniref:Beta-glucuronidase C-terminal domain-containing protein n=1 Tax=Hymenoscyphus fraxineus TaxID=746836 RepID=A0A9N9L590_9HELO|nr:hypothetical protein HYFRA_00000105 [Hymenoscyphus fraxineus]